MDTKIIRKLMVLSLLALIMNLFNAQIIKGKYFLKRAQANYIRVIPRQAIRGEILDRNGIALAYDRPIFNIAVIPYQIKGKEEELFNGLAQSLQIPVKRINRLYKKNRSSPFAPVDIVVDVNKDVALKLFDKFKPDILINDIPQRFYPFDEELSHVLGYVKSAGALRDKLKVYGYTPQERIGFSGVEQYYDGYLRGQSGGQLLEVDSTNKVVGFLGIRNPLHGQSISLTIDSRMQKYAFEALKGRRGAIIMMDSNTGEIIVFAVRPSFNVNHMIRKINISRILNDSRHVLLNRGIQSTYAIGSVFKPILSSMALEEEKIVPSTTFVCNHVFSLGNFKFRCTGNHGKLDLVHALVHSCNIYFYNVGLKVGIDKMSKWAPEFGFGRLTGIDLPYEKKGVFPSRKWKKKNRNLPWYPGDTVNTSIGQGFIQATPLQTVVAMSIFANQGYKVKPYLLKKVGDLESSFVQRDLIPMSEKTLEIVAKDLRKVVSSSYGTARILDEVDLKVSGKTGTAQNPGKNHGWFVGFFPSDKPKYTFCVFLEHGASSYYALKTAKNFLQTIKENGLLN